MKTLAKTIEENGFFNVYLEETGKLNKETGYSDSFRLVMPDEATGRFDEATLRKKTGIAIAWPVNPHSSGETTILQILNANGLNVTCHGYGKDQDGRWFKK